MDDDLRAWLDVLVRSGFSTRQDVVEAIAEAHEGDTVDENEIERAVDDAFAEVRAESRTWPAVTDNDRLDRAFETLTAAGVIARQDFACCASCARAEIWDEVEDPTAWIGNVWFHGQDTERAVAGGGLYLGYGARDDSPTAGPDVAAIGRLVADAVTAAGLRVTWDGSADRRILVEPFVWQRRPPD